MNELSWSFPCLLKFRKAKSLLGWCFQKWTWPFKSLDSIICYISRVLSWVELIFCILIQFRKGKNYFNGYWVDMVKYGCRILGRGTLKSALYEEWIDELSWLFECSYKFRKAKIYFNSFWLGSVKYGCYLSGHDALKSVVFQYWR